VLERINAHVLLHRFDALKRRRGEPDFPGKISERSIRPLRF
jgi:hypothetical protein